MEMTIDLRVQFHESNAFLQDMVSGFNLCEKLLGPQVMCVLCCIPSIAGPWTN